MNTFISLFTGGGGADIGALAAGLTPVAGLEYDAAIANVARQNIGDHIRVGRVEDADYSTFPAAFWLHASPPCTTASQANTNGGETALDLAMAQGVCRAITTIRPRRFSLENVWGYRTYASFAAIMATLHSAGYAVNFWHLNSADYGVPQTRKRLILMASLDHTPRRPPPTHCNPARIDHNQASMFSLPPWIGWYEAIADIAHTLPNSQFAPWQLARLPAELRMLLIGQNGGERGPGFFVGELPAPTLTAGFGTRVRALLVRGANAGQEWGRGYLAADEPLFTATAAVPRALLIGGGNTNKTILDSTYRDASYPAYTTSPANAQDRAFICDGTTNNSGTTVTIRDRHDPMLTIKATVQKSLPRAYIGRVVSATPRALARWQSVPDSYILPDKASLAYRILGNMKPPLFMQRTVEANL